MLKYIQWAKYRQKGLSLIELIISLTLGVLLILGLGVIYQVSNQATIQANAVIDVNAKGYRILELLKSDFDKAGYIDLLDDNPANMPTSSTPGIKNGEILTNFNNKDIQNIYDRESGIPYDTAFHKVTGLAPIVGCDGVLNGDPSIVNPNFIADSSDSTGKRKLPVSNIPTCSPSPDTTKQSIQISYQAIANVANNNLKSLQNKVDEVNRASGAGLDCQGGVTSPGAPNYGIITNRYFLEGDVFKCEGSISKNAHDLFTNVKEFVIRYRITNPATKKEKSGLRTDKVIDVSELRDSKKNPLGLAGITGVQVCLVIEAEKLGKFDQEISLVQPSIPSCVMNATTNQYNKPRLAGDRRYYKRFIATYSIPNLMYYSANAVSKKNNP